MEIAISMSKETSLTLSELVLGIPLKEPTVTTVGTRLGSPALVS